MKISTPPVPPIQLGVVAVPPLARNSSLQIDESENTKLVRYLEAGGIQTLLYGGNAVFYHVRLSEYAQLLAMLSRISGDETTVVPSVGPAYGTMMDQASILREFQFPTVMVLPQKEIADPLGIARGIRNFAEVFEKPIVLYLKHDRWLPPEIVKGLVDEGLVSWIKYAVVRDDPSDDDYLRELLDLVDSKLLISGIGEQPAIVHLTEFGMASFTSGCVCAAPKASVAMLAAIRSGKLDAANEIREQFRTLEDLRNRIQPIRVLHRAIELAGIAKTGPILPLLGELTVEQETEVKAAAEALVKWNRSIH